MNYINILDGCNSSLGTCCKDYGIVRIVSIYDSIFSMIQIIVPILLMVMAAFQLFRMMSDPAEKKHVKSLKNKFIAASVVFFIPVFVNLVISIVSDSANLDKYETLACLKEAKNTANTIDKSYGTYKDSKNSNKKTSPLIIDPSKYKGNTENANGGEGTYSKQGSSSDDDSGTVTSTSDGKKVVEYAKKFIGKRYKYGGQWNGSPNYTPTDCSGFVKGVYAHFGYNIPRVASASLYNSSSALKKVSRSNLQAGDLVLYSGHVAMLTGNGNQIIHASNARDGIKYTSTYNYRGSDIIAFYRVKGIN